MFATEHLKSLLQNERRLVLAASVAISLKRNEILYEYRKLTPEQRKVIVEAFSCDNPHIPITISDTENMTKL